MPNSVINKVQIKDAYTGEVSVAEVGAKATNVTLNDGTNVEDAIAGATQIQYTTMPTPSVDYSGRIVQYVGTTTADYINGDFYKCVLKNSAYTWERIDVQQSIPQYTTMPTASADYENKIVQYSGTSTSSYMNGFFYQCVSDGGNPATYTWVEKRVENLIWATPQMYGAKGDGITNDTQAFKQVCANHEFVYIPKGYYLIDWETYIDVRSHNLTIVGQNMTDSVIILNPNHTTNYGSVGVHFRGTANNVSAKYLLTLNNVGFYYNTPTTLSTYDYHCTILSFADKFNTLTLDKVGARLDGVSTVVNDNCVWFRCGASLINITNCLIENLSNRTSGGALWVCPAWSPEVTYSIDELIVKNNIIRHTSGDEAFAIWSQDNVLQFNVAKFVITNNVFSHGDWAGVTASPSSVFIGLYSGINGQTGNVNGQYIFENNDIKISKSNNVAILTRALSGLSVKNNNIAILETDQSKVHLYSSYGGTTDFIGNSCITGFSNPSILGINATATYMMFKNNYICNNSYINFTNYTDANYVNVAGNSDSNSLILDNYFEPDVRFGGDNLAYIQFLNNHVLNSIYFEGRSYNTGTHNTFKNNTFAMTTGARYDVYVKGMQLEWINNTGIRLIFDHPNIPTGSPMSSFKYIGKKEDLQFKLNGSVVEDNQEVRDEFITNSDIIYIDNDLQKTTSLGSAVASAEGIQYLYVGPTTAEYTHGGIYECQEVTPNTTPKTYHWVPISVTEDQINDIWKAQGELGAKNLIPFPYSGTFPDISQGVTFSLNNDKSISANGTSLDWVSSLLYRGTLKKGEYILSSNTLSTGTYVGIFAIDSSQIIAVCDSNTTSMSFTLSVDTAVAIVVRIAPNITCNNNTFYPMLRLASDPDDTWQPYAPTNRELNERINDVYKTQSILGAKNLLKYPYKDKSGTYTNVTITTNEDGSITLNGTNNTGETGHFYLISRSRDNTLLHYLKQYGTSFRLSGGNANPLATLQVDFFDENGSYIISFATANDETSTLIDIPSNANSMNLFVRIENNVTFDNLTIHPMVRFASDTDDTWQPYTLTNRELSNDVNNIWEVQGLLGAKNLLAYPYKHSSQTINGVTFNVNTNGSITINGTATGYSYINLYDDTFKMKQTPVGEYILSCNGDFSSLTGKHYFILWYQESASASLISLAACNAINPSANFTITQEMANNIQTGTGYLLLRMVCDEGVTISNKTYYPMIRLASDPDSTWVPYAKTNRELMNDSANKADLTNISITGSTNNTGATISSGTFFYKDGNLAQAKTSIANGAALTLDTNYELVTAGALNKLNAALNQPLKREVITTTSTSFVSFNIDLDKYEFMQIWSMRVVGSVDNRYRFAPLVISKYLLNTTSSSNPISTGMVTAPSTWSLVASCYYSNGKIYIKTGNSDWSVVFEGFYRE